MRPLIDYDRLLEVIGTEAERMAGSADGADPSFDVPGCPGLTLGETVRHVGSMYRMVLSWLSTGVRPSTWQREPDEGQSVEDFLLAGMRATVEHLSAHDPEEPCSSWWPEHQAYGFWYRRLAHETTVHRADVQGAAGIELDRVPEDVALDGIDEILQLWFTHRLTVLNVSGTRYGRVKVHSGRRAWIARSAPSGTTAWRAESHDEPADGTVAAPPHEMYLWLWGRIPPHTQKLDRDGSDDAIAQLWALLRLATR